MKQHTFKLRSELHGQHVRTTVFAGFGEEDITLANCGTLTMNVGEWQAFGVLLLLGADHEPSPARVISEGDLEVVNALQEIGQ